MPSQGPYKLRLVCAVLAICLLAGCGGGGGLDTVIPDRLDSHDYAKAAYQSPNYHPHESISHAYLWGDTVHIGSDLEPKEALRHLRTLDGINYFMGASRDGVGVERLRNYATDLETRDGTVSPYFSDDGFYPFRVKPRILLGRGFEDLDNEAFGALVESVQILNDALPPEFQIEIAGDYYYGGPLYEGDIVVAALSPVGIQEQCSRDAVACASNNIPFFADYTRDAVLRIPNDFDASELAFSRTVVVHELLHALGIRGHVDSIEFPDSVMGTSGDFFPNLGFTIHRIDREVLQIMYMSQRTRTYNDWGEWSDTSLHIVGRSEDEAVHFGVALFNGLPQPWARGKLPDSALADNTNLTGSVSWNGQLLGFSGPSPIAGDVELEVALSSLDDPQDLRFRDIYFFNRFESEGDDRWFPTRNLDYEVDIVDNQFTHSSDDGLIRGVFLGPEHEGMAGTIKRTDLVGAFGGTRPVTPAAASQ